MTKLQELNDRLNAKILDLKLLKVEIALDDNVPKKGKALRKISRDIARFTRMAVNLNRLGYTQGIN